MVQTSGRGHYSWSRVKGCGAAPPPCCCHTLVPYHEKLILFGGAIFGRCFNDVYVFDLRTDSWHLMRPLNDEIAYPRMSHSSVLYKDMMVVFGGMNNNGTLADMIALDLTTFSWSSVHHVGEVHPGPKRSHAAAVYKDKMYVLMGRPEYPQPDLWSFDFSSRQWKFIRLAQQWGRPPVALHGHSVCVEGCVMYVFGGASMQQTGSTAYFNDLHTYDFERNQWTRVDIVGARPTPRYAHAMGVVCGKLFIHGGDADQCRTYFDDLWVLDTKQETPQWFDVTNVASRPSRRSGHAYCVSQGSLYIFGGEAPCDNDHVFYSGGLYKLPLSLPLAAPLADLAARWLSRCVSVRESDLDSICSNAALLLFRYLPCGDEEILSGPHAL